MCLAAAAVAAAIARPSWVLTSVPDEASRVFQIRFFLPFQQSLCRCNLPAQSCIQWRHGIWFAKTVVLRLVLELNWSSRRRPDEFSTYSKSVLFSALRSHQRSVLIWGFKWPDCSHLWTRFSRGSKTFDDKSVVSKWPRGNSKDGGWNVRMERVSWRDMTCALQTPWAMRIRDVCTQGKCVRKKCVRHGVRVHPPSHTQQLPPRGCEILRLKKSSNFVVPLPSLCLPPRRCPPICFPPIIMSESFSVSRSMRFCWYLMKPSCGI